MTDKSIFHFQRKSQGSQVSIERLFSEIRENMAPNWTVVPKVSPFPSSGVVSRLRNLVWARREAGIINHIVGDVHYLAFAFPKKGLVLTIHDCASLSRLKGWKREVLRQLWFVQPMKRAQVVTAISNTSKEELRKWVGSLADKVIVIPNCVDSAFQPCLKVFSEIPTVLQVGTGWNKNLERVAQALIGTGGRLEIIGNVCEAQMNALYSSGIEFQVLGRVSDEDLLEAYKRCDLVVFASLYEGFGLPIVEAQAIGRPVITSNRSSMPEVAGDGALLVNPESVDEIRDAIVSVINNSLLRENIVQKGFENVMRFRPETIASRYLEIYQQM